MITDMYFDFLVRGNTKEKNECVEGNAVFTNNKAFIAFGRNKSDFVEVIPETIRKNTKLFDKNAKKIFDGDIVTLSITDRDDEVTNQYTCVVIYNNLGVLFEDVKDKNRFWLYATSDINTTKDVEIIGNRVDNPEYFK